MLTFSCAEGKGNIYFGFHFSFVTTTQHLGTDFRRCNNMVDVNVEKQISEIFVTECRKAGLIYLRVAKRELTSSDGFMKLCQIKRNIEKLSVEYFSDELKKLKVNCVNLINSYIRLVG